MDVRVGTIGSVAAIDGSDKLMKLRVNFGDHSRTIVVGLKQERDNTREIEGKQAAVLAVKVRLGFCVLSPSSIKGRPPVAAHGARPRERGCSRNNRSVQQSSAPHLRRRPFPALV
jgi:hypothetical protein